MERINILSEAGKISNKIDYMFYNLDNELTLEEFSEDIYYSLISGQCDTVIDFLKEQEGSADPEDIEIINQLISRIRKLSE